MMMHMVNMKVAMQILKVSLHYKLSTLFSSVILELTICIVDIITIELEV